MDACLADPVTSTTQRFALRFQSLFNQGRAMVFPCDARGEVDLDALSERARAGVPVHVLLDWVGSAKMEESYLAEMKRAV